MKAAPFDYVRADSLAQALETLQQHGGDAKLIAGGQSLVPMMAMRLARPSCLIDINRLDSLKNIQVQDQIVQLGANTATVNLAQGYIGYLTESYARVRIVNGYPANYMTMYKSYGSNSQLNPLRVRVQKGESALRVQAFPDPRSGGVSPMNPLGSLMLFTEFGVGVGDRTAGATNRSNASWADGSAT